MINYYEVLGVDNFSDIDKIKKMYRKLSMIYHPDMWWTQKKFIELNTAYGVLNNEKWKEKYDFELKKYLEELNNPKPPPETQAPPKENIKNTYQSQSNTTSNYKSNNSYTNERNTRSKYDSNEDDEDEEYDDEEYEYEKEYSGESFSIRKALLNIVKFIFSKDFLRLFDFRWTIWRWIFLKRLFLWFFFFSLILDNLSINKDSTILESSIFYFFFIICISYNLSTFLKRYNDLWFKNWYLLLFLIPYINFAMFWILVFKKWKNKL